MEYSWNVHRAIALAAYAHDYQRRKGGDGDIPYISHPFAVATLANRFFQHEAVFIAALLHDVLEDCPERSSILFNFSEQVQRLVSALTDPKPKDLSYLERKQNFIEQVKRGGEFAVLISACDKIHNMSSVIESLRQRSVTGTRPIKESIEYWDLFYNSVAWPSLYGHDLCALYRNTLDEVKLFLPIAKE